MMLKYDLNCLECEFLSLPRLKDAYFMNVTQNTIFSFLVFALRTDCAYLDNQSYSVLQPTAWIPLLDANEKNGCMQVNTLALRPSYLNQGSGCVCMTGRFY